MGKSRKISPPHRGLWVYKPTWIGNETSLRAFDAHAGANDINEVYLSTNLDTLASDHLPGFIGRMSGQCITVEALIGKPAWAANAGHADMISQLDKIIAYNAAHDDEARFSAVHLDIETWIGSGESLAWLAGLLDAYSVAKTRLGALALSVAVPGSKMQNAPLSQRAQLVKVASTIVLMQYEADLSSAVSRTMKFCDSVSFGDHVASVALRAEDFPGAVRNAMDEATAALRTTLGVGGWAIFEGVKTF